VVNAQPTVSAQRSEILCFMQQKMNLLTFDHLVKLCLDFYRKDEILAGRSMIDQFISRRLPKRQGTDALKSTLEDVLKLLLDPAVKLPIFYAVDLGRLPPVGADHCDMSAILKELHELRSEVRMVAQLKEEVDSLKKEVASLRSVDWPPLSDGDATSGPVAEISGRGTNTVAQPYAVHARNLRDSGIAATTRKPRKAPVVGKSSKFDKLSSVVTKRSVDIFVSRWNPHTTESEVSDCVNVILQGKYAEDTRCERLKAKYEHLYSSFFVSVVVPSECMREVIEILMKGESWPNGILVKRYFRPKNGSE